MKNKPSHKEFLIENLGQAVVDRAIEIYGKGESLFDESKEKVNSICSKAFVELSQKPLNKV